MNKFRDQPYSINVAMAIAAALWTTLIALAALHEARSVGRETVEIARFQALAAFDKDTLYRKWNASHGGVYVPVSGRTPPNPNLSHVSERDIVTQSGRKMTLVNPAYMTRQVFEDAKVSGGTRTRITSLRPIAPMNVPDDWERESLKRFEEGSGEEFAVSVIGGKPYMRLMRPFVTEESCLKCHAEQGYEVGDVRGGISVSVPLEPLYAREGREFRAIIVSHLLLWLIGLAVILEGGRRLRSGARRLAESELRFRRFLSDIDLIAVILDRDGNITFCNDYLLKVTGWERHELLGGNWFDRLLPREERTAVEEYFRTIIHTPDHSRTKENHVLTRSGAKRLIRWSNTTLTDESGMVVGAASIGEDVTDLRNLERHREDLYAMLRHDLKSPMTVIHGSASLLKDKLAGDGDGSLSEPVDTIISSANRVTRLVDAISTISRMDSGAFEIQKRPEDVDDIMLEVYFGCKAEADRAGVSFVRQAADGLDTADMDRANMARAIENMVRNSIRYTPKGGNVRLAAERVEVGGTDCVRFTVTDDGPGIPAEEQPMVFDKYYRSPSVRDTEGTGLGLAIAKAVAEAHGGSVGLVSAPGKGSEFSITVPVK